MSSTHSQPGKPGAHVGASVCGNASERQVNPGRHSLNGTPGLRSRTGVQIGEQTSGAGMLSGSTERMHAEPGSHAILWALHLPCTQTLPDVRSPLPCVEPFTFDVHSVKIGDVQSALVVQARLSGRQTPSGPLCACSGESVVRAHTSGAVHGSLSVGVAGTLQRVR